MMRKKKYILKPGFIHSKNDGDRCYNTTFQDFHNYGGRGIKVCDRWMESFENFLEDIGECPDGMTLERIDNDGDYCKKNCRWANRYQQDRNKNSNIIVNYNGIDMVITDIIKLLSVSDASFYKHKRRHGLTHQEVVNHYANPRYDRTRQTVFID
jgi:hypothetical protein